MFISSPKHLAMNLGFRDSYFDIFSFIANIKYEYGNSDTFCIERVMLKYYHTETEKVSNGNEFVKV